MGVHLIGVYLMGVYLTGVYLIGVYLISVHPISVHLISVHLIRYISQACILYILILFSVRSVPFKVHADVPIRYRR
jgi:hypothetical protein